MIVTLTANPSVDRTIEVASLTRGSVIRALSNRVDAGGKGVNVARALARHGIKATAVVPNGGSEGAHLQALLDDAGVDSRLELVVVPIAGAVRSNVTVVEADGTTTKLNEPGPRLTRSELDALADATVAAAAGADCAWVVLSGSLPPGAPAGWYAEIVERVSGHGPRIAVDTSGSALAEAVRAQPDLLKPNRKELEELVGHGLPSIGDIVEAADKLTIGGPRSLLASLGPAGAVLVDATGRWHASAPRVTTRSSVGAGDALLAGYLAAGGRGPGALSEAVAWGSAAAALPGSRMPGPSDIERTGIVVTDLCRVPAVLAVNFTEEP